LWAMDTWLWARRLYAHYFVPAAPALVPVTASTEELVAQATTTPADAPTTASKHIDRHAHTQWG
jgi:hypothetical protein